MTTGCGTLGYNAPERFERNYEGVPVDIFSIGVTLFVMYAGCEPFQDGKDYPTLTYKKFQTDNDQFWKTYSQWKEPYFYSESFKDLINKILHKDPKVRLSYEEILKHKWLDGFYATPRQIVVEFNERISEVEKKR